jgi:hypothetical protein
VLDTVEGFSLDVITNPDKLSAFNSLDFSDSEVKYVSGTCSFDKKTLES